MIPHRNMFVTDKTQGAPASNDLISDIDHVLITQELAGRPSRLPDHQLENRALAALAHELATSPATVLAKLVDIMVAEGIAASAGVSILEPHDPLIFRWIAVAGAWSHYVGGTMPFHASPCGAVVTRDTHLLFKQPHTHFPAANVEPRIHEILLVPFHVNGTPTGTLWAIAHDKERKFDSEDLRLLTSLAEFAAAAYQMVQALDLAKLSQRQLEARVEERTAALRKSEQRFRQFGDASSDILWIRDAESLRFEYVSPAFADIYGVTADELSANDNSACWSTYILPEDRARAAEHLEQVRHGERVTHEFRVRRQDGQVRWVHNTDFPLLDEQGQVQRIGGIAADVTEQKKAEETQKTLVAELQHRTRNLLAVVRSIARQTIKASVSFEAFQSQYEERLSALSRVQSLLSKGDGFSVPLRELLTAELEAHGVVVGLGKVVVDGPDVILPSKAVQILALALHELATNAGKHGGLTQEQAKLMVQWRLSEQEKRQFVTIFWHETGVLMPAGYAESRRGFGRHLIERALPFELGAETSYRLESDGVRCEIKVPLA